MCARLADATRSMWRRSPADSPVCLLAVGGAVEVAARALGDGREDEEREVVVLRRRHRRLRAAAAGISPAAVSPAIPAAPMRKNAPRSSSITCTALSLVAT